MLQSKDMTTKYPNHIIYSWCVSSGLFARLLSVQCTIATHKDGYLKITTEVKN